MGVLHSRMSLGVIGRRMQLNGVRIRGSPIIPLNTGTAFPARLFLITASTAFAGSKAPTAIATTKKGSNMFIRNVPRKEGIEEK